jgi:hypothetical protein
MRADTLTSVPEEVHMNTGGAVLFDIVGLVVGLLILYFIIRGAVGAALEQHYKVVRRYEATGEWRGRSKPPLPFGDKSDLR